MRLLVLGGTRFVGRAVVQAALADGWDVTVLNRGVTGPPPAGVRVIRGDRVNPDVTAGLAGEEFDACVDTWWGAPSAVAASAGALAERCGRYVYVSSRSVYEPLVPGSDEDAPVVDADPDAGSLGYPQDKRGAELAVLRAFGPGRSALLRCGVILGPGEDVGRLPWWLLRMARGGEVLAPGPVDLPLQYVDARDLASFALTCAAESTGPVFNVASRRGHATMGSLLEACMDAAGNDDARLVWVPPGFLLDQDAQPWVELPLWLPPGHEAGGMHDGDAGRAASAGLTCRSITETVCDTWAWVSAGGWTGPPEGRPVGMEPVKESAILASWRTASA